MKHSIFIFFFFLFFIEMNAQEKVQISGKVSYKSSQNTYVRFMQTQGLKVGDTLFVLKENTLIPALVVSNLSSVSCACSQISGLSLPVSTEIIAFVLPTSEIKQQTSVLQSEEVFNPDSIQNKNEADKKVLKQQIRGSISASSYSQFSNTEIYNTHRFDYRVAVSALNIGNSKISIETNLAFRYKHREWDSIKSNLPDALRIYSLHAKYDFNKNSQLSFGRKINANLANIGITDGLQYEQKLGGFALGAVLGTRPNMRNLGIDFNLPLLGIYLANTVKTRNGTMQNSAAFIEARNANQTDRRFVYFQHSNTLLKHLYFFGSAEIDLYKKVDNEAQNAVSFTGAYASLTYRMTRRISVATSYDNRKNVIYYESYKSSVAQLLKQEARQGISAQLTMHNLGKISAGYRFGYRLASKTEHAFTNMSAYVTWNEIGNSQITTTLSGYFTQSASISGKGLNLNASRSFFNQKLFADCGYQLIAYGFLGNELYNFQHIASLGLSWKIYKKLYVSANFEEIFEAKTPYEYLAVRARYRF